MIGFAARGATTPNHSSHWSRQPLLREVGNCGARNPGVSATPCALICRFQMRHEVSVLLKAMHWPAKCRHNRPPPLGNLLSFTGRT